LPKLSASLTNAGSLPGLEPQKTVTAAIFIVFIYN
jgi:hypothetical protein